MGREKDYSPFSLRQFVTDTDFSGIRTAALVACSCSVEMPNKTPALSDIHFRHNSKHLLIKKNGPRHF